MSPCRYPWLQGVQCSLSIIYVSLILQIVLIGRYNFFMLEIATSISYGSAIGLSMVLARRFLARFFSKRAFVVLLYGVSSLMLGINASATLLLVDSVVCSPMDIPTQRFPMPQLYNLGLFRICWTTFSCWHLWYHSFCTGVPQSSFCNHISLDLKERYCGAFSASHYFIF